MIHHQNLGHTSFQISRNLYGLIRQGTVTLGGNHNLKIYGMLGCKSGKRMKITNRVFFRDEHEAIENGFRPCSHCLRGKYLEWKQARSGPRSEATPKIKNEITFPQLEMLEQ